MSPGIGPFEPIAVRLARLEERVRTAEAELASVRLRLHALGNHVNQLALSPSESEPTHPRQRRRASEGFAMTTIRLITYALGIGAAVAAFLVPHPQAQLVLLPVATGLLGLATNTTSWMQQAQQKTLDSGK